MAVLLAASCMMTGCGDSKPTEDDWEQALEDAFEGDGDDLESMLEDAFGGDGESEDTSASETEPTEIVYEPLPEILDAPITAGLIQIGDDIFKRGGYYTVNELIAEFGDKYDFSGINPDGYIDPWKEGYLSYVKKIDDEKVMINVSYSNTPSYTQEEWDEAGAKKGEMGVSDRRDIMYTERIKIGDAIVTDVTPANWDNEKEFTWYAGQAKLDQYMDLKYDDIPAFLENELGLTQTEDSYFSRPSHFSTYVESGYEFGSCFKMDEKNLYGVYPVFYAIWSFNLGDNKATEYEMYSGMYFFRTQDLEGITDIDGTPVPDLP